jgi:hypothetical protein
MAIVKRQSGSWKSILVSLGQRGLQVEAITDLPKLLDVQSRNCAEIVVVCERERGELQKSFDAAFEKLSSEHEQLVNAISDKFGARLKVIDGNLEAVRAQERTFGGHTFWFRLIHFKDSLAIRRTKGRLLAQRNKLLIGLQRETGSQKRYYDEKKQKISRKNDEYRFEIEKKANTAQEKVSIVEEALKSGTYFGAIAELKMIDLLSKLPDSYYVLNDVTLKLPDSVNFDGDWLSSAQIDHLVIGPAGVFVVEVKNWSKKFVEDGDFFNPFQQVKRHNYVCYTLLGRFVKTTVRSIVACAGYLPDKPDSSYAKVLSLEQVNGYILWFKDVRHDEAAIQKIVQRIEKEIEYANKY